MRGATGQLGSHLQPEARQLALLQVVVNEEANPDGQWNDAGRSSCQHIALLQNYVERNKEEPGRRRPELKNSTAAERGGSNLPESRIFGNFRFPGTGD